MELQERLGRAQASPARLPQRSAAAARQEPPLRTRDVLAKCSSYQTVGAGVHARSGAMRGTRCGGCAACADAADAASPGARWASPGLPVAGLPVARNIEELSMLPRPCFRPLSLIDRSHSAPSSAAHLHGSPGAHRPYTQRPTMSAALQTSLRLTPRPARPAARRQARGTAVTVKAISDVNLVVGGELRGHMARRAACRAHPCQAALTAPPRASCRCHCRGAEPWKVRGCGDRAGFRLAEPLAGWGPALPDDA